MKKLSIALIIILACGVSASAAKPSEPSEADKAVLKKYGELYTKYTQSGISYTMSTLDPKEKEKSPEVLVANKANKMSFTVETGEKGKTITFFNTADNTAYQYFPESNTAFKIPISSKKDDGNVTAQIENALEIKIGDKDTINGYKCQWITIKTKKDVSEVCYTEIYGVPAMIKNKKTTVNFTNFSTKVKDADVTLPANADVTELSLKGLAGKAKKENEPEQPKTTAKETAKNTASGAAGEVKDTGKEIVSDVKSSAKEKGKKAATGAIKGFLGL